ncbi:MAG: replicative DNA helicase [Thermacetogeniaceae bacterium]
MQQVPYNADAEIALLGEILFDPSLMNDIAGRIKPDDFFVPQHKKAFKAMQELWNNREEINAVAVADKSGEDVLERLLDWQGAAMGKSHAQKYVDIVLDYSKRRKIIGLASNMIKDACETEQNKVEQIVDDAQKKLFELIKNDDAEWEMNADLVTRHYDTVQKRKANDGVIGVTSGFKDLDECTGGWQPGQLIFLGAVPKMGKTALALHFALHADVPVLFFTLEMLPEELADRQFSSVAKIPGHKIKTGHLSEEEWVQLVGALDNVYQKKIGWVKKGDLTVSQIKAICMRFQQEHGLGLVIIDQLDKIATERRKDESRSDEIGRITRGLKLMAMDLKVPVICLVQLLDKQISRRTSPRPTYGDIRDSSCPDQDGDVILYLWRPEFYKPNDPKWKNLAEIIVARQRSGKTGSVWVRWFPDYTAFANLAKEDWPKEKL